jgi:hypothetical protein
LHRLHRLHRQLLYKPFQTLVMLCQLKIHPHRHPLMIHLWMQKYCHQIHHQQQQGN